MALADFQTEAGRSLAEIGKIRTGEKIKSGSRKGQPTGAPYFVIKGETEGEKDLIKVYGENPKELTIFLPFLEAKSLQEWKKEVVQIRYEAWASDGKNRLTADETWAIIKCRKMYELIVGSVPKGDMPKGGWRIDLPEGVTWDDHENFQKVFTQDRSPISIKCRIKMIVKDVYSDGVFTMVTSSVSVMKNINEYINGLIFSQEVPFMVATKITKEKIKVQSAKGVMTPYIVNFEKMSNWKELTQQHIDGVKAQKAAALEMAHQIYFGGTTATAITAPTEEHKKEIELAITEIHEEDTVTVVDEAKIEAVGTIKGQHEDSPKSVNMLRTEVGENKIQDINVAGEVTKESITKKADVLKFVQDNDIKKEQLDKVSGTVDKTEMTEPEYMSAILEKLKAL